MVKIDVNQDYYADLELPQSVDTETVKKQYRKLALKYHPDRNPGGEVEAGKRFTRIQAAYEVLTNPEQKQRYDTSRRSRFPGASGVKGNPWQDVTKNYPPPPRPPGFPQRPPPPKRPGSTTAADRYAQFAKDVPPNSPRNSRKPADATWKAWEEMRPGTKAKATAGQASGQRTPYMSHGGEKLDPFQGAASINRSRSTRETNSASYQHSEDEDSPTSSARQRRASVPDNLDNDPNGKRRETRNINGAAPPNTGPDGFSPTPEEQSRSQQEGADGKEGSKFSFGVQYKDESFTDRHRFSRNSADNINTRFVADESDASNWQFNAGSPVDETGRPAMPRSKSGSRVGRKSPFRAQSFQVPSGEPANEGGPPQNSSFNPEEWSEKIGPQIFQTSTAQKANTARPIRNPSKKPKPVRMTAGTAGMVESDESSSGQDDGLKKPTSPGNANGLNETASPNAMDIDPPMDYLSAKGVRNIPVEPSRPEWRAGDVKGMTPGLTPGAVPHACGSEDTEEFRASLSDLKNVEPFAQRPTGLDSFGDLKSTLPFLSGASGQAPIAHPQPNPKPTNLHLPVAPKPPNAPPTFAVAGLKPSAAAWEKYAGDFYRYLTEWHRFNTKFSEHFHARNLEVQKKVIDPGWVKSRDPSGIQEYLTWAEQDRQVRATWAQACDNHEMHVRVFMAHRDKMLK
ncbi:hypothetical protein UCDDA912_g03118 [Diaporthe ampelina]|uniref:J domain-containing protein n=1 Tax=Diaporthe ampelina TaxID=1214573 RepID=A0A0G2FSC7_9PEZI|nr:hypothetical protein UCDDA912_g03118 [Diaporthe ampelina]